LHEECKAIKIIAMQGWNGWEMFFSTKVTPEDFSGTSKQLTSKSFSLIFADLTLIPAECIAARF
jgi:hypothetical protein